MEVQWGLVLLPLLGVLSVLYWLLHYQPRKRLWAMGQLLPGPKPWPIIGNLIFVVRHRKGRLMEINTKIIQEFGPLTRFFFSDKVVVFIARPDDVPLVLGSYKVRNRSTVFTKAAQAFIGEGLICNRDDTWRKHRKLTTPMFHSQRLETYVNVFVQQSSELLARVDQFTDGTRFDVYPYLAMSTLQAICENTAGSSLSKEWLEKAPRLLMDGMEIVYNRILLHMALPNWLHWMVIKNPKINCINKIFRDEINRQLNEHMNEYRSGVKTQGVTTSTGKNVTSFKEMLEASVTSKSVLSQKEIEDELVTFAAAGMETTANTMAFCLILLAIHPDIQDKVQMEMVDIFGGDSRPPTSEDVIHMEVLDRVIKETLRLFPIVPLNPREITEDIQLKDGHILPKGCEAFVFSFAMHRNEEYFPQPDKFLPDRWLPENSTSRHPYAYLPFSAGPRNCIGQKYAMLQMKIMLSTLLRRYHVTTKYKMADLDQLELTVTMSLDWPQKYEIELKKR